jgi:hypothetical protein
MQNIDLRRLGHIYFAFLFIASIAFYRERTLYMDCAYHVFNMINTKSFFIASQRYSVVIPEIVPLFLIKLKASLPLVLIAFSVSYILLYYVIYLVATYVFKVDYIIIPIMLVLSGFSAQSYFHIVTETHQGLMYAILLYAWLIYCSQHLRSKTLVFFGVAILIILLAFFAHPVTLFPILFIIGFFLINEWINQGSDKKALVLKYCPLLLIILLSYVMRVAITPADSYDGQFYAQFKHNILKQLFQLYPFKFIFFHYRIYWIPLVIVAVLFIYYRHKWNRAIITYFIGSYIFFFIITQLTFGKGDADVMMEKNFMPFAIFIGVPICYFLVNIATRKERFILLILVFSSTAIGLINELSASRGLKERINFYQDISYFAREKGERKLLVSDSCLPKHNAINWAIGAETLLYSSLDGKQNSMTAFANKGDTANLQESNLFLLTPFWKYFNENDLNSDYFNLGHQKYVNIPCPYQSKVPHFN